MSLFGRQREIVGEVFRLDGNLFRVMGVGFWAANKKETDFLSQALQKLERLQQWSVRLLHLWLLLRSANSHPGRSERAPDEDTPKDHAAAAEEHLIEEALVKAKSSSLEFADKIGLGQGIEIMFSQERADGTSLENTAESGVPE